MFLIEIKFNVNKIYNLKQRNRYAFCSNDFNKSDKI